jgi:hypothetical protein
MQTNPLAGQRFEQSSSPQPRGQSPDGWVASNVLRTPSLVLNSRSLALDGLDFDLQIVSEVETLSWPFRARGTTILCGHPFWQATLLEQNWEHRLGPSHGIRPIVFDYQ